MKFNVYLPYLVTATVEVEVDLTPEEVEGASFDEIEKLAIDKAIDSEPLYSPVVNGRADKLIGVSGANTIDYGEHPLEGQFNISIRVEEKAESSC